MIRATRRSLRPGTKRLLLHFVLLLTLGYLLVPPPGLGQTDTRLLQIKAAFTYRFILFTQWPQPALGRGDNNPAIRIGIVENRALTRLFEMFTNRQAPPKKIEVLFLDSRSSPEAFRSCQLLYIPASLGLRGVDYLDYVHGYPVLTVSDMDAFLERGGMISLFQEANKIRFSIDQERARQVGISFRSQLLKMASRIVEDRQ